MDADAIAQLTHILQLSITPVALISGVGLLLLSMTNRLGRVIDRARDLGHEIDRAPDRQADDHAVAELRVLFRRARFLQTAIALMATNVFLAVLMVATLFAMNLVATSLTAAVLALFVACLVCLVTSIVCFLGDIVLSIRWLRLSLGRYV